eukprot:PITA_07029
MVDFCYKYNISLGHSTAYHPQGNGLAESSNKSLVNIIKKLLEINKKSWHKKLVNALWAHCVSQKKSIGMSPFELVYGTDAVFPTSLSIPVAKLLQEAGGEEDLMQRRIGQMIFTADTGGDRACVRPIQTYARRIGKARLVNGVIAVRKKHWRDVLGAHDPSRLARDPLGIHLQQIAYTLQNDPKSPQVCR